jgi:hypothetical protein
VTTDTVFQPFQPSADAGAKECIVMMSCGFCMRALDVVEDFIYHEGQLFHPQEPSGEIVRCAPRVREFDGEMEACHALQLVPRRNP